MNPAEIPLARIGTADIAISGTHERWLDRVRFLATDGRVDNGVEAAFLDELNALAARPRLLGFNPVRFSVPGTNVSFQLGRVEDVGADPPSGKYRLLVNKIEPEPELARLDDV